ncbi:hypothetical protein, conserved [Angomonas deanei]|uniref:Uncharacterized protein n=1 Tax=Angomonas deanei TaxID=59799 RepID=A0A7G2C5I8_9TRYP|nr:hypothetical protein, conserved [Angomonas deanei]
MNQNGIPFGSWLVAPGYGNMERVSRSHNNSFRRGGNEAANNENNNTNNSSFPSPPELPKEEEDFMDRSKVEKPETDKNSVLGAASTTFPFSIELPSRGWKMDAAAASQGRVGAVEEGNLNHLITCTNETVFDLEAITEEEISSDASENPNKDNKTHSGSPFSETIQQIERERFQRYLDYVEHFPIEKYTDGGESDGGVSPLPQPLMDPRLTVNSYERNLEVWRQLWRAVEQSDVALLVADSRFPIVHLPLAVLHYITVEERKPLIIVLNKSDLVPSFVVHNWIGFLRRFLKYYGLHIMTREAEEAYLAGEQTSEAGDSSSLGAPIIIRTFTADPFGLTAIEEKGGQLNVQRRRRKNKKRRAKIYELLRSGKLSAHQGPSNHGDDTNNFYRANFKGMKKANQALNSEENELKEIQAVSKSIDELLQISKRLAKLFYGDKKVFQEKEKSPVEEQTEKHVDVAPPPSLFLR